MKLPYTNYRCHSFLSRIKLILTRLTVQDTTHTHPCTAARLWALRLTRIQAANGKNTRESTTGFQCFPLSNFKYFLTLFSKFFSSFPHGTCSLSVSRRYLALDEIYHPFRAAIPNNSTLWTRIVRGELQVKDGILTLYDTLFQKIYTWVTHWSRVSSPQFENPLGYPIFRLSFARFTRRY